MIRLLALLAFSEWAHAAPAVSRAVVETSLSSRQLVVEASKLRRETTVPHGFALDLYDILIQIDREFFPERDPETIKDLVKKLIGTRRGQDFKPYAALKAPVQKFDTEALNLFELVVGKEEPKPKPEPKPDPPPEFPGKFIKPIRRTAIKLSTKQSSELPEDQKCILEYAYTFKLTLDSFPLPREGHHYVTFAKSRSDFCSHLARQGASAYIFAPHWVAADPY